jgi:hypothetical protein
MSTIGRAPATTVTMIRASPSRIHQTVSSHLLNVQPVVDYELVEHALILELQASLLLVR